MPVNITIMGDNAGEALAELRSLSSGLTVSAGLSGPIAPAPTRTVGEVVAEAVQEAAAQPAAEPVKKGRAKKAEAPVPTPQIEEPTAEEQAQDAADEAREEDGEVEAEKVYTIDDVRGLVAKLNAKIGTAETQKKGAEIFKRHGHVGKLSDCKDSDIVQAIALDILKELEG